MGHHQWPIESNLIKHHLQGSVLSPNFWAKFSILNCWFFHFAMLFNVCHHFVSVESSETASVHIRTLEESALMHIHNVSGQRMVIFEDFAALGTWPFTEITVRGSDVLRE